MDFQELNEKAKSNLKTRLSAHESYTSEEIKEISNLSPNLFPGLKLSQEETNRFRTLCSLSNIQLRPAGSFQSHRPYVGWIIVAIKRLTWPLIKFHLKEPFAGLQEFAAQTVSILAKQQCEIKVERERNT